MELTQEQIEKDLREILPSFARAFEHAATSNLSRGDVMGYVWFSLVAADARSEAQQLTHR